jgi:general secretion pathway protein G
VTRQGRERALARGFTLIEVMIVMVILVLLASISLAIYGTSVRRADEAVLKTNLRTMREVIDAYYADRQEYPQSLDDLVTGRYLDRIPEDITGSTGTWRTTTSDPAPGNPSASPGISDVHSGSDQVSLEGEPYAEW